MDNTPRHISTGRLGTQAGLPGHEPPKRTRCNHWNYNLNCHRYEVLRARARWKCELCGKPEHEMPRGKLHIDHYGGAPNWQVRGLLCNRCNTHRIVRDVDAPEVKAYYANAWYKQQLAAAGLTEAGPEEPVDDALVLDHHGRTWKKTSDTLWQAVAGVNNHTKHMHNQWSELVRLYGPLNLHII